MFRRINNSYHIINFIFAGIILLVFIYSGIFSAQKENHPIPSNSGLIYGKTTPSTGLSRAFSEIVRLNFHKAKEYNEHSVDVFMFFFLQFFLRLGFTEVSLRMKRKQLNFLVFTDAIFSVGMFIYCFAGIIPI